MFQKSLEKMRKNEGGFTLIELLVVMIIIGLLAAIAIPVFLTQKDKARDSAVQSDLRNAAIQVEANAVEAANGLYAEPDPNELAITENVSVVMDVTDEGAGYCLAGSWAELDTSNYQLSGGSITEGDCS